MTINQYQLPVDYETGPTGMQAEKDSPTRSTTCSTDTLESLLTVDDSQSTGTGESNNASFVDLEGLLDEDLLDDDNDDDDDDDDDVISENELTGKEEGKATPKKRRKVVKVRASDLCHPDGGKIDPKQFEQVVKHLKAQKGGKGGIDKVPKIVMRSSSTESDSCSGPIRRTNSKVRSKRRRRRGESRKQVGEVAPKEVETRRRTPPRKISSISLDSFKSVLRAGRRTSKKSSTETDENDQDDLTNKSPTPFPRILHCIATPGKSSRWGSASEHNQRAKASPETDENHPDGPTQSPPSFPRILQRIATPGKSSRWGSGSEHSQRAQRNKQGTTPPSRPARTTMSPARSKSFPAKPCRMAVNPPPLVSNCEPGTKEKLTPFEREQAIRDAGITPVMIEKLRQVGLYISDTP